MRDFSLMFSMYVPVYIYAILVLYFTIYVAVSTPRNAPNMLSSFFSANKTWLHNTIFFITILSMLGTPPTVGFFGKMLTFYMLSQNPGAPLFAALVFTLALIIFYLQTIRAKAYAKKRRVFRKSRLSLALTTALLYGLIFMVSFAFVLPTAVDIAASLFF